MKVTRNNLDLIGLCVVAVLFVAAMAYLEAGREEGPQETGCDDPVLIEGKGPALIVVCANGSVWRLVTNGQAGGWVPVTPLPGTAAFEAAGGQVRRISPTKKQARPPQRGSLGI